MPDRFPFHRHPRKLAACVAALAALATTPAGAAAPERVAWSMAASACTVVDGDQLADKSTGRIRLSGDATGLVRLVCPIVDLREAGGVAIVPNAIFVSFLDTSGPEGKGGKSFVSARLVRQSLDDATLAVIAGVNSETAKTTSGRLTAPFPTSVPAVERRLDFDRNAYFVEITLQRLDPAVSLSVFSTGLANRLTPQF